MGAKDVHALLQALEAIALEAGDAIMRHYRLGAAVRRKADKSPVTDADEEAEAIIFDRLSATADGIPIVAEEAAAAGKIPQTGEEFFLVDPLDGTREFLDRNGEFTVNIALIRAGAPAVGVVFAPALERLFSGAAGYGAQETSGGVTRPIYARNRAPEGLTAVASRSHRDRYTDRLLQSYGVTRTVSIGSSIKFCLIAAGEADIYPRHGRTMQWDTAAGDAVLRAAGGRVTLIDGQAPLVYGPTAAGYENPHFIAWGRAD